MDFLLKKLAKNSLIVFNANFALMAVNFAFVYFAIRYLGLYDFGVFTLLLTTLAFAEQFSSLGFFPVIVSEIARSIGQKDIPEAKSIIYRFAQLQTIASIVTAIVFFIIAFFNFFNLHQNNIGALYVFGVYTLFVGFKTTFLTLFEGSQRFDLSTRFFVVESVAKMALLGGLVIFMVPSSIFYLSLVLLGGFFAGLFSIVKPFFTLIKPWLSIPRKKNNFFTKLIKEQGIFAFFTHQIKNIKQNLYPWIIKIYLGVEAVAVFSVLQRIQNALMKVVQPIDQTLLPLFSEIQDIKDVQKMHGRITKYSFWINSILVLPVITIIPFFLEPYIGQPYANQELTMILLLLTLPLFAMTFPIRSLLFRFREQAFILKLAFFMTMFWFVTTAVFASFFGLLGAGLAWFFFFVIELVIQKYFMEKKHKISFSILSLFSITEEDRIVFRKIKQKFAGILKKPA